MTLQEKNVQTFKFNSFDSVLDSLSDFEDHLSILMTTSTPINILLDKISDR